LSAFGADARGKELSQAILELMDEMKDDTINRILAKSDFGILAISDGEGLAIKEVKR
jgi:hypothetical protein